MENETKQKDYENIDLATELLKRTSDAPDNIGEQSDDVDTNDENYVGYEEITDVQDPTDEPRPPQEPPGEKPPGEKPPGEDPTVEQLDDEPAKPLTHSKSDYEDSADTVIAMYDGLQTVALSQWSLYKYKKKWFTEDERIILNDLRSNPGKKEHTPQETQVLNKWKEVRSRIDDIALTDAEHKRLFRPTVKILKKHDKVVSPEVALIYAVTTITVAKVMDIMFDE